MRNVGKLTLLLMWSVLQHFEEINAVMEDFSDREVDNFINEYVEEVQRTLRLGSGQHIINKRSQPDVDLNKLTGLELLVGFEEVDTLPASFPEDIILFTHCLVAQKQWYSAALETNQEKENNQKVTELVLYKYQNDHWKEKHRVMAAGGKSLTVEQIQDSIFIVVAQNLTEENLGSTVWHLQSDSDTLHFVHMLNTHLATHAIVWTNIYTYAAVAISENLDMPQKRYSTQSPVYRWLGNSFDMIDALPTYNPQALAQFNIRSSMFIAVANFRNDLGETLIDSEIFRYDLTSGKFNIYQKLPTEAAVDVKYFCFQSNEVTESFLIYASAFHTDERGYKDFNSPSVVYKLSDEEYFVPFQALQVAKVTSWLPVQHVKDGLESLILIGASEAGIISFQYDGWRFVPTGIHYDRSTFGPGSKSLNVFYFNDQTLISVANKESNGYDMNVFSPVFKHYPGLENLQEILGQWMQELIEGEVKMTELKREAHLAPSVNDSEIELGSYAEFRNAEIYQLETFLTKVRDSNIDERVLNQVNRLKSRLERLRQTLKELANRIDETSIHTLQVYENTSHALADIRCVHSCHVQELEVINVNGENLSDFLDNTVNMKEQVEFQEEIFFDELALTEPLNTKMINGHLKETLIDWTKEVIVDYKLEVEGDVIVKDSISVSDAVDGILINVVREEDLVEPEVTILPARELESLDTSELVLSDGKISEVDFEHFVRSTLKTHGDQIFTEVQDTDKIEADEVTADLFKAFRPLNTLSQRKTCYGKNCFSEYGEMLQEAESKARASDSDHNIDSINLLNDVIIIPRDVSLYGTVIIENGYMSAKDLVDKKHDISAVKLSESSIPLNQSVMEQHFRFNGQFQTPMLNVDTLNSLPLSSLINTDEDDIRVTGKKTFDGSLTVDSILHLIGSVNGAGLTHRQEERRKNPEEIELEYLNVNRINSKSVRLGKNDWKNQALMEESGSVIFKAVNVDGDALANSVMVRGRINNYHLEKLLNDTVFHNDDHLLITGTKHFIGKCEILNLIVNSSNNTTNHFIAPETLWRKQLLKANSIGVEKLFYTGKLDGLEATMFGKWLLTEGDQNVTAFQEFSILKAPNVVMSSDAMFNSVNINQLFTQAVLLSDNATFDSVVFGEAVDSCEVEVGGRLSGLEIPADIVVADPAVDHLITGHKSVRGSMSISGDLNVFGLLSDVDLAAYCLALSSNHSSLTISGNATFEQEPDISVSINNMKWPDILHNVWFKEDNVTLLNKIYIDEAEFETLLVEKINNNNVEERLSKLVSLSKDQEINGTFYFSNVKADKGLKASLVFVGGNVQGIKLTEFLKDILLNGVDQNIEAYLDFQSIIIENNFINKGFVNGLNLSTDLMLRDVASNTVSAELRLDELRTNKLKLPYGSKVAGVDIDLWNRTAVSRSSSVNVINGNIVITSPFDSSRGIRVEQTVNGLLFDKTHVMLLNVPQEVTGRKTFSSESDLMIRKLDVKGFLNDLNITNFYQQQVTDNGDVVISGHKKFTAPLVSERVVLPEIYQSHNLSWLESELSAPLPWPSYYGQQARIEHFYQLASHSLAGGVYYLKNLTRAGDVEGDVLYTFPLKSGNISVLAAIRRDSDRPSRITLSLLQWSENQNMFLNIPGSVVYFPRVVPSGVQMITLPGGELAAYVTSYLPHNITSSVSRGELFRLKDGLITQSTIYGGKPGSTLLSFLDYKSRTCFVVVEERCRVYCHTDGRPTVRVPSFSCMNITKATLFTTDRGTYVMGVQTRLEGSLLLWRMFGRRFTLLLEMPLFNPVSIAATTTTGPYIAVANKHQLGSSHPETVDLYRFDENTSQLKLDQSLPVVSPHVVVFSSLPTSESVLYVASVAPASPLQVYIYRGLLGYQLLTVDSTLPIPSDLQPFTDHQQQHFLVVLSQHKANVLKGEFVETHKNTDLI